ncbi:substrate-binding domain-containing protein [Actinoplanes derwentensis]|nr:substrate-binding domain-containing protein [Actinoplanes derwentensis]GID88921.1 phosphate-binding protein [Actinoplanes derwentensis]
MTHWELEPIIAVLSVAVPFIAFVWEFAIVRRKRLGYRVQMDTPATSPAHPANAAALAQLHENGRPLHDPSFVLLRVENAGWTEIVSGDYLADDHDRAGIRVTFPGRRVVDVALSETSQDELADFFFTDEGGHTTTAAGFGIGNEKDAGLVRLPKVKLNPRAYYKVLVVLERQEGNVRKEFDDPSFRADVSGRHNRWIDRLAKVRLDRTESHTFASRPALVGIGLLVAAVLAQSGLILFRDDSRPPLDCVGGTLYLHGSTAFAPSVTAAAARYEEQCRGVKARIPIGDSTFQGSAEGVGELEAAGRAVDLSRVPGLGTHLAFTDGYAEGSHPQVLPRPIAYSLYTLIVNKDVGVRDLSLRQIRDIYARKITDWSRVGGPPMPIQLVNRHPGSGTRTALVNRVLQADMPNATVNDCAALEPGTAGVCEVGSTQRLLEKVAATPGALGYSEVSNAAKDSRILKVHIDHDPATLAGVEDGGYPYWQTEYAYTYGELPADSIGAAFLRYLTDQEGKDILREHGNRPCAETEYPLECEPR